MNTYRRYLSALILLLGGYLSATTVTGTIQDTNGNRYASGTVSAFNVTTGASMTPAATDINGFFSITLSPSTYLFTVCARPVNIGPSTSTSVTQVCAQPATPIVISGGSQDVSAQINAVAPALGPSVAALLAANNTFTGINTFGALVSSLKAGITAAQPGSPALGSECTASQGDTQNYTTILTTTDSSNGTHQVICGSKEGGIFFPLIWMNPFYDGNATHGGDVALYVNMSPVWNPRNPVSPDYVGIYVNNDSLNGKARLWAMNGVTAISNVNDATAWGYESDMVILVGATEPTIRELPFLPSKHKIAFDAVAGGPVGLRSTYAYAVNTTNISGQGFFTGLELTSVTSNGIELTGYRSNSGPYLFQTLQSTTSVAPGTSTITITCANAPSGFDCAANRTQAFVNSSGASLVVAEGTANEEYVDTGNWSILNGTQLQVTFALSHTQPYSIRNSIYPTYGVNIGDPSNYTNVVAGFFRQFRNTTISDALTLQRRSDSTPVGNFLNLINVAGTTLAHIDISGKFYFPDGTCANPGVATQSGGTGTGFYRTAGNYVAACSAGTEVVALSGGVRVGSNQGFGFATGIPSFSGQEEGIGRGGNGIVTVDTGTPGNALGTLKDILQQFVETSAPSGVASSDLLWGDSTTHTPSWNNNNNGTSSPTGAWQCTNVTPVTVNTSTTADQNVMACTIPAGTLNRVGRTLRIVTAGVYSTPAASTAQMTVKVKLCTVSGCGSGTVITLVNIQSTALGTVQITNDNWSLNAVSTTQTAGATSSHEAHGDFLIDLATLTTAADSPFGDLNTATIGTIDATAQLFLQATFAFSAASASNTSTERQLIAETIN